jgi:hypothetical protein
MNTDPHVLHVATLASAVTRAGQIDDLASRILESALVNLAAEHDAGRMNRLEFESECSNAMNVYRASQAVSDDAFEAAAATANRILAKSKNPRSKRPGKALEAPSRA